MKGPILQSYIYYLFFVRIFKIVLATKLYVNREVFYLLSKLYLNYKFVKKKCSIIVSVLHIASYLFKLQSLTVKS